MEQRQLFNATKEELEELRRGSVSKEAHKLATDNLARSQSLLRTAKAEVEELTRLLAGGAWVHGCMVGAWVRRHASCTRAPARARAVHTVPVHVHGSMCIWVPWRRVYLRPAPTPPLSSAPAGVTNPNPNPNPNPNRNPTRARAVPQGLEWSVNPNPYPNPNPNPNPNPIPGPYP